MVEYSYLSDQMMDLNNDPLKVQDSYSLVNLRTGLRFVNYDAEVILWGRNVLDEDYHFASFDILGSPGKLGGYASEPATYGLTLRKNF